MSYFDFLIIKGKEPENCEYFLTQDMPTDKNVKQGTIVIDVKQEKGYTFTIKKTGVKRHTNYP